MLVDITKQHALSALVGFVPELDAELCKNHLIGAGKCCNAVWKCQKSSIQPNVVNVNANQNVWMDSVQTFKVQSYAKC